MHVVRGTSSLSSATTNFQQYLMKISVEQKSPISIHITWFIQASDPDKQQLAAKFARASQRIGTNSAFSVCDFFKRNKLCAAIEECEARGNHKTFVKNWTVRCQYLYSGIEIHRYNYITHQLFRSTHFFTVTIDKNF